jgi:hypothetical protein
MESRQGQDLANDGLQMAAARKARWHASTVRLRCGADPLRWCPCGCLISLVIPVSMSVSGMNCCWLGGRWTFGYGEPSSPSYSRMRFCLKGDATLFRFGRQVRSNPATDTPNSLSLFPENEVLTNFDSRAVRQSELSAKIGGGANAGLMGIEENIKPFPSIPTVLGNHQKTVITTFAPHCDYY